MMCNKELSKDQAAAMLEDYRSLRSEMLLHMSLAEKSQGTCVLIGAGILRAYPDDPDLPIYPRGAKLLDKGIGDEKACENESVPDFR